MRHWLRDAQARPAATAFLVVSLAVSLAGGLSALALNAAVQWRALPFRDADALVRLELQTTENRGRWWSGPELRAIADAPPPPLEAVAGYTVADYNVLSEAGRPPEALLGTLVSPKFFDVLGVGVRMGRAPNESDFSPGSPRVVVLGHELWQRRYGADPSVVGRTIRLAAPVYLGESDRDYLVVGVLSPDAWLFWKRTDLVLPLRAGNGALADPARYLVERVIGRVAEGGGTAAADLDSALLSRFPPSKERISRVAVTNLASSLYRDLRPQLLLVLVVACLVLGLAGTNVMIAMSADVLSRQRETAVRVALGATAGRLAGEIAQRALMTTGASAALSLLFTAWSIDAFVSFIPDGWLARVPDATSAVRIDGTVLLGLLSAVVAIVIAMAVWSRLSVGRLVVGPLLSSLQPSDAPQRQWWRWALVGAEMALCAATVVVATTLLLQLQGSRAIDLGVASANTVAVWVNASPTKYADAQTRASYFNALVDGVAAVPGVEAVGAVSLPFHFDWDTISVRAGAARNVAPVQALDRPASSTFQDTAGLRLLDGRWLAQSDRMGSESVVVVSSSLAKTMWPGTRAVGRQLALGEDDTRSLATVIGVVGDTRTSPHLPPSRTLYRPLTQATPPWIYVVIRTARGADVWRPLTEAIWKVDADQPVDGPWSVDTWIAERTSGLSFLTRATAALAGIGVVLAFTGLFGLTTHWVAASGRELGIRRAVGASHGSVVWWFGRRWLGLLAPAILVGLALQAVVLRFASASIQGLRPATVEELIAGVALVTVLGAAAAAVALRRALRVNPQLLVR